MVGLMSDDDNEQHPLAACGRWLMSITQEDADLIQQTREFRDFMQMVGKIQQTHRNNLIWTPNRIISNTRSNRMVVDIDPDDVITESDNDENDNEDTLLVKESKISSSDNNSTSSSAVKVSSFLQYSAADDIVLKMLDFLECHDLIRMMRTCSRLHYLVVRNAKQRTKSMSYSRQLDNVMQLLRAHEQIHGVGIEITNKYVRVPTLLLSKRILISNSGDPEYNGVYFCTGTNGNGFVFTKPRYPERRVRRTTRTTTTTTTNLGDSISSLPQETLENSLSLVETETAQPGELLRCIIAKRFSNETILWYLSKEVITTSENEERIGRVGEISQRFSFWAKLMVIGDASPDICRYPSQTSILTRQSLTDGWQNLSTTRAIQPPVVELLD